MPSLQTDVRSLRHVLRVLGDTDIATISGDHVTDYQALRKREGALPSTINTELRKLKAVLNWCHGKCVIEFTPEFEPVPEYSRHIDLPSPDEAARIIAAMPDYLKALMRLMFELGLRKSEAYRLRWAQVDLRQGVVHIEPTDEITPKNVHSVRTLYLGQRLAEELACLPRHSEWVFPSTKKAGVPIADCRKAMKTAIRRSGVKRGGEPIKLPPKYARKFFTTYLSLRGASLPEVKRIVGHSPNSRVTERHYIHVPHPSLKHHILELPDIASSGMTAPDLAINGNGKEGADDPVG